MRIPVVIVGLGLCIPCFVLPLLAVGIGAGAFSALGAWFSGNGLVLVAAVAVAVAFVAAAGFIYVRRANAAACEVDEAGAGRLTPTSRLSELDRR